MTNKWDRRFLALAQHIATWSKDPSRKIGAVAVGEHRNILATGYNGFPARIIDTEERLNNRDLKYDLVVHAEMNCIYNAGKEGVSLRRATMYVWGLPVCHECAKGIIQAGFYRVVIADENYTDEKWINSFEKTQKLFREAGIICDAIDIRKPMDSSDR